MARRFIVDSNDILINDDKNIKISGTEVKHIQVLRHEVDDEIIINKYICKIKHIGRDYIELEKLKDAPVLGVPNINLTLYIAVLKNDKLDSNLNECMIGIPVDDNNYKISKVYSYDLDNNVNYYYLSKDGFREISKNELKDKFSSGNFTKTSDNSFVPGIIEKDGTILKEHEESEVVI